jgi:CNT family concentrative nucleoside transporter
MYNIISLGGIFLFMVIAWLLSSDRKIINWRVIIWGILFQMIFALFLFLVPAGTKVFLAINDIVIKILDSSAEGAKFVFGRLALPPGTVNENGETSIGPILAFQVFPTIIFFSALMSILYFFKIMPLFIRAFAYVFTKLMRISGAESLNAVSNIFVGIESVFTIKPYIKDMTRSELFTLLTVCMSTVASNVMALYVFSLKDYFPNIAGHLVSASFLSAPAAIIASKLMMPETEKPKTLGVNVKPYYEKDENLFMAIINGANSAVKFIVGIVALLIAVIGLVALVDLLLGWIGGIAGSDITWSLKKFMGYLFYPFTLITGVPPEDAGVVSQIIGERLIVTEVVAYTDLADVIKQGILTDPRSIIITSYALCGFAHISSMAIFIGGISALIPSKASVLARMGIKSLIAATIACLMTACIAGLFSGESTVLFGG